jgi:hypothetical protein
MPLTTSSEPSRPNASVMRAPARPDQFAFMAIRVVGWLITAGVHSTVWILAITATLIRRARWKSSSSDHDGYSRFSASQIALCSSTKSEPIRLSPSHHPGAFAGLSFGSSGSASRPSGPMWSLPSEPLRARFWASASLP